MQFLLCRACKKPCLYLFSAFETLDSKTLPQLPKYSASSVQLLSRVRLFATPRIAARQASLSITNSKILTLINYKIKMI